MTDQASSVAEALFDQMLGYARTQALYVAAKLGVPDLVAAGPLPVEEIALRCGAHAPSLNRVLRCLVAEGVFAQPEPGVYAPTPMSAALETEAAGSIRPYALHVGELSYRAVGEMLSTVCTGEPGFDRAFGSPFFTYLRDNPEAGRRFDAAMAGTNATQLEGLLRMDWGHVGVVADLGGGQGLLLASLLREQPELRAVLYDQEHVLGAAKQFLAEAGVGGRCELVAGDFFDRVPEGADVYVLSRILHDWSDEQAVAILRNVRAASGPDTRLLILDLVLSDEAPHSSTAYDVLMMTLLPGHERTEREWRELCAAAGFAVRAIHPSGRRSVLECHPV